MNNLSALKFRVGMKKKLVILLLVVFFGFLVVIARIAQITATKYDEYAVNVLSNYTYTDTDLAAARGTITDRNGNTLAESEAEYILILESYNILKANKGNCADATQEALIKAFGLDRTELSERLNANPDSQYYRYRESDGTTIMIVSLDQIEAFEAIENAVNVSKVSEKLTALADLFGISVDEVKTRFPNYANMKIQGVWFEKRYKRVYPYGTLACKVVGFYSSNYEDASTGIEKQYNQELTGTEGKVYGYLNDDYNLTNQRVEAIQGDTVVSTIDVQIQSIVEEKIAEYMSEYSAENVGVIVMNPNNGEIYAMATDSYYDLNDPTAQPDTYTAEEWDALSSEEKSDALNEIYKNFCISSSFEPGSVYKAFTVATAYEEGKLTGDETFYCGGYRIVNGWKVRCHNRDGCGELNIFEALENSCNVCLMQIADLIGKEDFGTYFNRFGFGQKTGIDLPGEIDTSALVYSDYTTQPDVTLACASFGQGFNVTMVEVCAAFASLVNGGYYYTPHVVKEIQSADGTVVYSADTTPKSLTISKETSEYMKQAVYAVVENGTASTVQVEGYNIGGKTGSAEMVIDGKRADDLWCCSIVTACPIEDPQVLIYTVVDRSTHPYDYNNSLPAQRISKAIYEEILPYLNIHSNLDEYDYINVPTEAPVVESSYEDNAITSEVGDVTTDPDTGLIVTTEAPESSEEQTAAVDPAAVTTDPAAAVETTVDPAAQAAADAAAQAAAEAAAAEQSAADAAAAQAAADAAAAQAAAIEQSLAADAAAAQAAADAAAAQAAADAAAQAAAIEQSLAADAAAAQAAAAQAVQ